METILTLALASRVEACNTIDQQLAVKRQDHFYNRLVSDRNGH